jgi:threonine aldolase
MIKEARRHRKLFGGGMRQVGIIAAGALFALQHHRERLKEDHNHAQILAESIRQTEGLTLQPDQVDTNIVIFRVDPSLGTAAEFVTSLREQGVLMLAIGPTQVRAVTHLDVNHSDCSEAAQIIGQTAEQLAAGHRPGKITEAAY